MRHLYVVAAAILVACGGATTSDTDETQICEQMAQEADQFESGNFQERVAAVNASKVLELAEAAGMTGADITAVCGQQATDRYQAALGDALEP